MTDTARLAATERHVMAADLSPGRLMLQRFMQHRAAVASAIILVLMALATVLAGVVEQYLGVDGNMVELTNKFAPPSAAHPLGTDELGRDLLVRLLYGGRISLGIGLVTAVFAATIGTCVGLIAGFYGGRVDAVLMRITDGVIALPLLPLLIILAAVDLSKLGVPDAVAGSDHASLYRIVVIIALFGWTTVARLVRAGALSVRRRDYITAARALGVGQRRIMVRHILPNVAAPVVVATTLSIGNIILLESVLSFLGLGIQPPVPSWGNMLTRAQELIWTDPLLTVWPGMMIFVTVIAFNFLGDGLQDALDPRALSDKR